MARSRKRSEEKTSIGPVQKSNIGEQVYNQLRNNLIQGTWRPGEKILSEAELANRFGTSRATVRHALSKLAALGLIETRVGEGSFVREAGANGLLHEFAPFVYFGKRSIREIMELRVMIESEAAEMAALRATEEEIEELRSSLEKVEASQDDFDHYIVDDVNFHTLLADMTHNSLVVTLYDIIFDVLVQGIRDVTVKIGGGKGWEYHRKIYESIRMRDSEKAMEYMRAHLIASLEAYENQGV